MVKIAKITEAGWRAYLDDCATWPLDAQLQMEILAHVGGETDVEQLIDLAEQLEERFGSTEAALAAVRSGKVGFKVEGATDH
jgi:hypothetical protein